MYLTFISWLKIVQCFKIIALNLADNWRVEDEYWLQGLERQRDRDRERQRERLVLASGDAILSSLSWFWPLVPKDSHLYMFPYLHPDDTHKYNLTSFSNFKHVLSIYERRKWQPTPVLLPGESHGQRSLAGYSPHGHKESDVTEWRTPLVFAILSAKNKHKRPHSLSLTSH